MRLLGTSEGTERHGALPRCQNARERGVLSKLGGRSVVPEEDTHDALGSTVEDRLPFMQPWEVGAVHGTHSPEIDASSGDRRLRVHGNPTRNGAMQPQALALITGHAATCESFDLTAVQAPVDSRAVGRQRPALDEVHDVLPRHAEHFGSHPRSNERAHGDIMR